MIRQKISIFSGIAVFLSPAAEALDVSVGLNLQIHSPAYLVSLIFRVNFFKFQIVCKIFLRSILGLHSMFRMCLQQRQANF